MYSFNDKSFLISQGLVNRHITGQKRLIQTCLIPNFIKYLINIRVHFTIKNKVIYLLLLD